MSDAPTLFTVALSALGVGAGALKVAQLALRRNGHKPKAGQLDVAEWEKKIADIDAQNLDEKIIPILQELKAIAERQNEIQQSQNLILTELVTVSRMRRTGP